MGRVGLKLSITRAMSACSDDGDGATVRDSTVGRYICDLEKAAVELLVRAAFGC